jgi:hypothetical protein
MILTVAFYMLYLSLLYDTFCRIYVQDIPGDLRAQALSYLMFHKCNLVKDLPLQLMLFVSSDASLSDDFVTNMPVLK